MPESRASTCRTTRGLSKKNSCDFPPKELLCRLAWREREQEEGTELSASHSQAPYATERTGIQLQFHYCYPPLSSTFSKFSFSLAREMVHFSKLQLTGSNCVVRIRVHISAHHHVGAPLPWCNLRSDCGGGGGLVGGSGVGNNKSVLCRYVFVDFVRYVAHGSRACWSV